MAPAKRLTKAEGEAGATMTGWPQSATKPVRTRRPAPWDAAAGKQDRVARQRPAAAPSSRDARVVGTIREGPARAQSRTASASTVALRS